MTYHEISLRFCVSVEDPVIVTGGSSGWVLAVAHHLSQGSRGVAKKFVIGLKRDGKNGFIKFVRAFVRPVFRIPIKPVMKSFSTVTEA